MFCRSGEVKLFPTHNYWIAELVKIEVKVLFGWGKNKQFGLVRNELNMKLLAIFCCKKEETSNF